MGKVIFYIIVIALIGIQFIKVERSNPPVTADLNAPAEIKAILKNSCYDCHSNQTKFPWYSSVAPISWMIADHVKEGRAELNFSDWEKLSYQNKSNLKKKIWEEVNNDEMPLSGYTIVHPTAQIDEMKKLAIKNWALKDGYN